MKFNICLIKPNNYVHADAYWELAELLAYSLRDLGYETSININEIETKSQNIIFGCHLLPDSEYGVITNKNIYYPTIIFNTEQLYLENNTWTNRIFNLQKDFRIWDYNIRNIERLNKEGFLKTSLFEIGYHKKLERIEKQKQKNIDVLMYGSMNERRKKIIDGLKEKKLNVKVLFGVYGAQRDEYISRSKIVLNIHFYNSQLFEIVRVHYLLNNKIPVVCEMNSSTQIDPWWRETIFGVDYSNLVDQCLMTIENTTMIENSTLSSYNRLRERQQTQIISDLLQQHN